MDAKSISIKLDDDREMDFKRTDKTKFFKNGDEVKSPSDFKPGDQVSVEGPEDTVGERLTRAFLNAWEGEPRHSEPLLAICAVRSRRG